MTGRVIRRNILYSIILLLSLSSTALAGGMHNKGLHDAKKDEGPGHWMAPEEASKLNNPIPAKFESIMRGKYTYLRSCATCHGDNADGNGPVAAALTPKPANLIKMSGIHSDSDFAWKIMNGRGSMPAWKNILSMDQIWDLVNYIQSLSNANSTKHNDSH